MSEKAHRFLTLEDFFEHYEQDVSSVLPRRSALAAWSLKDVDIHSEDGLAVARRVQTAIMQAVGDRPAEWLGEVEESRVILDFMEWVDWCCKKGELSPDEETGYGDIDLNLETQKRLATQMCEFHKGEWAMDRLEQLYQAQNFTALEPFAFSFKHPLPDMIDLIDRDINASVRGGMTHPQSCSYAVGALTLHLFPHDGEPEAFITITRREARSSVPKVVEDLKGFIDDLNKELGASLKDLQTTLSAIPTGWPNDAVYSTTRKWANARFQGDNGLVGSDFFEGSWVKDALPSDLHRNTKLIRPDFSQVKFLTSGVTEPSVASVEMSNTDGADGLDAGRAVKGRSDDLPALSKLAAEKANELCMNAQPLFKKRSGPR